jgi:CotH kinase protein/Lamin Tail Domain
MQLINPALDNDLGGSWRSAPPTPGAVNAVFAANAPPQLRQVDHLPVTPPANAPVTVTVKATDPDGIANVSLLYQAVAPGSFIPAFFPLGYSQLVANPSAPRAANPAFENAANWISVPMRDDGFDGDALAGDGIFTGAIPGQPNRTLLRYRIHAADTAGVGVRVPHADDPSLNFACFVFNGVPAYTAETRSVHSDGAGHVYPVEMMTSLPVHTLITRSEDLRACNAYASLGDTGQQIPKANDAARSAFNWEGAFVHDGVVYDHMKYRLRQANDRYAGDGKRSMRFRFNRGHHFQARDHEGKNVKEKWESINTGKMSRFGGANISGLREVVNAELWRLFGVDMPHHYHAHFRVIDGADEAPAGTNGQYLGDFFGLAMFYEDFEGSFLANRDLPDGNIYKWKDGFTNPATLRQFQAADGVTDGSDLNAIYQQLRPERDTAWLRERVDWDNWYRYHSIAEAVRHYDFGVTSAHLKNRGWYFMPAAGAPLGLLRHIPHDHDATWYRGYHDGLTVGIGVDFPMQAIYGYNGITEKAEFTAEYRNVLRELRDLLWREDVVNPMIDRTAARIAAFHDADRDRWLSAPATAGFETAVTPLATVVSEMKNFAFVADTVNGATLAGGRGAYLDQLAHDSGIPATPVITYSGQPNYPANGVTFEASAYVPGAGAEAAIEWRLAEITDATAPARDPLALPMYEISATWQVKLSAPFLSTITVPTLALRPGHTYRARVRHTDTAGRASHWSSPLQFTATAPDVSAYRAALVISEFSYRGAGGNADLEFVELLNTGSGTLDLTDVRFTKGIDFDFAGSAVTSLAPGARVLVVRNTAAFTSHYGPGLPIAGEYQFNDENNLNNGGEQLKLSFGAGVPIQDFIYDATAPWPVAADGAAFSLVLRDPFSRPDHTLPHNWLAGSAAGTPGVHDATAFTGLYDADADGDSLAAIVETALGTSDGARSALPLTILCASDGSVRIQLVSMPGAPNVSSEVQASTDLMNWQSLPAAGATFEGVVRQPDGTSLATWNHPAPVAPRLFLRIYASVNP